nr:hypothetical protein [Tanacetum cinerariifolium]
MNPIATQQAALDNALVSSEKRLKIERCNARIAFTKPQKEETYKFWNTIKKIGKSYAYNFKLDKKKCRVDTKELGYSGKCDMLSTIRTDQMHQPWRTFAAVINRCISGKSTGLDRLRESSAYILWAMYYQKNVDYVALLWEDFMYQADNREISTLKFISKTEDCQIYEAVIPDGMINDDIKLSKVYKTYLDYVTGKVPPKKAKKFKIPASPKLKTVFASPKEPTQKAPAKISKGKGIKLLSDATLLEVAQMKKALKKSKHQTHNLQASGLSEGADFESEVPDEQTDKPKGINKRTGEKPGVPNVSKDNSTDSEADSWGDSEDESDNVYDEDDNDDDDGNDDDSGNDDDGGNDDSGNEDDYEENPS